LKVVEHLSDTDYQGGDEVISKLLDERWPQKERSDEMGEHISEIFGLKAKDCETVRQWCGRARECFDPCKRKAGASFPDEARRWILFQCSGLNEEKRAVVLARTQGELKFHTMALSMRSYYPDFVVSRRKSAASAHLVEPRGILEEDLPPNLSEVDFQDVELFLTECGNEADAAAVTQNHLSKPEDLMLQNATLLRKSAPSPCTLPWKMHLCRSSSNVPRLPSNWTCYKTLTFCSLLTRCTIPCACHAKRDLNVQKWSVHGVL